MLILQNEILDLMQEKRMMMMLISKVQTLFTNQQETNTKNKP